MNNDKQLQNSVQAELGWEPSVEAAHIGVAASGGVVTLTGHVRTFAEKIASQTAAARVRGVRAIADELEVHLSSDANRSDDEIAASAIHHLDSDVYVPRDSVKVKVECGLITLTGQVSQRFQKDAASQGLHRLLGVKGVTNQIVIQRTPDITSISDDIMHALHRSWLFDVTTINVNASDGKVRLSGTAASLKDRQVAASVAWSAPGVTSVVNDIEVL